MITPGTLADGSAIDYARRPAHRPPLSRIAQIWHNGGVPDGYESRARPGIPTIS